ncbi:MAG TPA: ABC transporter ATP-binding protein, partial [Crocinitomicaceae bacterium]|nr:ABC transporter ATP-binding protein [Crocinitomicaceae bacterium]
EGDAKIKDLLGNYTAYRKQMLKSNKAKKNTSTSSASDATEKIKVTTLSDGVKKEEPTKKIKLSYKENAEFEQLEGEMEQLEEEKAKLTLILSDANASNDDLMDAGEKLSKVVKELETKADRWLELSEYV